MVAVESVGLENVLSVKTSGYPSPGEVDVLSYPTSTEGYSPCVLVGASVVAIVYATQKNSESLVL